MTPSQLKHVVALAELDGYFKERTWEDEHQHKLFYDLTGVWPWSWLGISMLCGHVSIDANNKRLTEELWENFVSKLPQPVLVDWCAL